MHPPRILSVVAFSLLCTGPASAATENLPGQHFRPAVAAGAGNVYSAAAPESGASAMQLWLFYGSSIDVAGNDALRLRHRTDLELTAATAATERLVVGFALRGTLYQDRVGLPGEPAAAETRAGLGDARIVSLLNLLSTDTGFAIALLGTFGVAPGSRDAHLADAMLWASPELALSWQLGAIEVAGNAGLLMRPTLAGGALGDEATYRAAVRVAGLGFELPLDAAVTVSGSTPIEETTLDDGASPLEALALVDAPLGESGWSVAVAGGGALVGGRAAADLRAMVSVGYGFAARPTGTPTPPASSPPPSDAAAPDTTPVAPPDDVVEDSDGDGIANRDDGAPYEPEDLDGVEDDDGIPD